MTEYFSGKVESRSGNFEAFLYEMKLLLINASFYSSPSRFSNTTQAAKPTFFEHHTQNIPNILIIQRSNNCGLGCYTKRFFPHVHVKWKLRVERISYKVNLHKSMGEKRQLQHVPKKTINKENLRSFIVIKILLNICTQNLLLHSN